jgi:hypothetical protein
VRSTLTILGGLAVLIGLLWAAQGSGYFPYPASSFMNNQNRWIAIGLAVAIAGLVLIAVARRF